MAKERWVSEVQFSPIWERLVVTNVKIVIGWSVKNLNVGKSGKGWSLHVSMVNEWLVFGKNLEITSSPDSVLLQSHWC